MALVTAIIKNTRDESIPVCYPITGVDCVLIEKILAEPKVKNYFAKFDWTTIKVNSIELKTHIMFGLNLGFLFMNMDCEHRDTGKKLPGVVFLRGDSVASLIIIRNQDTNELFHVLVEQCRVPMGKKIREICAGMVDSELTRISGAMVKEIKEEIGIDVHTTGMQTGNPYTQYNYLEKLGSFIPSGGGCDEQITLFWYQVRMSTVEITRLHGKETGAEDENEFIKVIIEPLSFSTILATGDSKAICAYAHLIAKYPSLNI